MEVLLTEEALLLGNGIVLGEPSRNCWPIQYLVVPTIKARLVVLSEERTGTYAKVEGRGEPSE